MLIVLSGVAGSGKTTIGRLLASELGWPFYEGDDLHPPANREKMRAGKPLDEVDRAPWLAALRTLIEQVLARGEDGVLACSALRRSYREYLHQEGVCWVYLRGDPAIIRERLRKREGHFFPERLLDTQLEILEEPRDALVVSVEASPSAVTDEIIRRLGLQRAVAD